MLRKTNDQTDEVSCDVCGAALFVTSTKAELVAPDGTGTTIAGRVAVMLRPFLIVANMMSPAGAAPVVCPNGCLDRLGPEWVRTGARTAAGN